MTNYLNDNFNKWSITLRCITKSQVDTIIIIYTTNMHLHIHKTTDRKLSTINRYFVCTMYVGGSTENRIAPGRGATDRWCVSRRKFRKPQIVGKADGRCHVFSFTFCEETIASFAHDFVAAEQYQTNVGGGAPDERWWLRLSGDMFVWRTRRETWEWWRRWGYRKQ